MEQFTLVTNQLAQGVMFNFKNGYGVSVRWGRCNYCDNRDQDDTFVPPMSNTAELAVLDPHGDIIPMGEVERLTGLFNGDEDGIFAYVSADEVIEVCERIKRIAKPLLIS